MRRHDARKWLHAILDLLPVILIPVFMIYSHRHTIDSYTIDVPQNRVVDFNQVANTSLNNGSIVNNLINGIQVDYDDITKTYHAYGVATARYDKPIIINLPITQNNKYYFKSNNNSLYIYGSGAFSTFNVNSIQTSGSNGSQCNIYLSYYLDDVVDIYFKVELFNLTQMFGAGNEPTIEQFNTWYPNDYYEYTLSHKELLKGYSTITYDDTDIMSQFTYNLYNSVDKYFNMNNVFGLNGVYDWFNLNIFNGNAPLYIYVIWNIVLYEFVMDLLMLLYALFMWFIDFCQDLIDRCFTTSKGGKH